MRPRPWGRGEFEIGAALSGDESGPDLITSSLHLKLDQGPTIHAAAAVFRFLRHPIKPNAPKPVAKSGSAVSCPLYPRKRTCAVQRGMSALCQ